MLIEIIRKSIILFIILLIIQPFSAIALMDNQIFSDKNLNDLANKNDNDIFGFIISYPSSLEISNNQEIQYKILNMINDLARNNINIYWIPKDIELFTKNILSTQLPENRIFSKGSFIIPFTGQNSKDIISTIIISEYSNNGSILNVGNISKNIYFIIEPIQDIKLYQITEPKIAYYFDQGVTTRCINWYMSALYKAGFLNNEILDDNDLSSKLENMRSNVLIWPGGNMFESFKKDLSFISILKRQYSIKNFVSNGGGFVGSCYGAFIASSGMRFTPFLLLQYYFPRFPSIGFFSFSDTLLGIGMPSTINVSIESTDSPVVFGLNGTLTGSVIRGGPVYTYIGKNSESLAKVEDIDLSWLHWIDSLNNSIPRKILNKWANFTIGKTIWISSKYNKGKIVTFGDHPEQGDIKLQRAVHNSVLYVRSELIVENNFQNFYPNLYVEIIINSNIDTLIEYNEINIFYKEFNILYDLIDIINLIEIKYNTFTDLVNNLRDNENIETNFYYQMMSAGFWEFKEFINNSKNSLDNSFSDDDTIHNLEIVSSLSHLFSLENITIEDKIDTLRNELNNRLKKINLTLNSLDDNMNKIIKEIQNYENTSEQNEYIINLIESIKKDSKEIVKNLPLIYFNSIMDSRDLSFSYKYELINKI